MQNEIREYNGTQYSVPEGAAIISELNRRTVSDNSDLDTLKKLGDEVLSKKYKNVLNTVNMTLDWGHNYGASSGVRNEIYATGNAASNEPMVVHMLFLNISSWDDIKDFSPKLRIERYRQQSRRSGSDTNRRTGGFKYDESNPSFRPTLIDITSASMLLDIKPEEYYRINTSFPKKRGTSSTSKYTKQLLQFKIEITVNGNKIVSIPLKKINIVAKKGNQISSPHNIVTYTQHV